MHSNIALGTSMAYPHLEKIDTLIKASNPSWNPWDIKSIVMTTTKVLDKNKKNMTDAKKDKLETRFSLE